MDIQGSIGELRMVIEIKRAATGETETYELIGTTIKENEDVSHSLDSSEERSN